MDIGVIFREQVQSKVPPETASVLSASSSAWSVHHIESAGVAFELVLAQETPAGLSCGWTSFHGGWTAWVAERTTLLELRRALPPGSSMNDEDIMSAALERWGFDAVKRTQSIWAGAIWNDSIQELRFFRDRIGMVPVFRAYGSLAEAGVTYISTSMQLMHQVCPKTREINFSRLRSFLLYTSDRRRDDFFGSVSRLHPGECWCWKKYQPRLEVERYWHPGAKKQGFKDSKHDEAGLLERLREISVDYFESDYSLLTLVSGGIDSTLLLSLQIEQMRQLGVDEERVRAVTMGFPSFPSVDETYWTQQLQCFLKHPISSVDVEDCWPLRDRAVFFQRPELGPSFHPGEGYEVEFIKKALSGDARNSIFWGVGADQLFTVNSNVMLQSLLKSTNLNIDARIIEARRRVGTKPLIRYLLGSTRVANPLRKAKDAYQTFFRPTGFRWRNSENWLINNQSDIPEMTSSTLRGRDQSFLSPWLWELITRGFRRKSYYLGASQHLPYLRSDLIDTVLGMEPYWFNTGSELQKTLLRNMSKGKIPDAIRTRPKGGGFSKFIEFGLGCYEHQQVESFFSGDSALADHHLIEPKKFLKVFAEYRDFCWSQQGKSGGAGEMLMWRTVSAELWCRQFG